MWLLFKRHDNSGLMLVHESDLQSLTCFVGLSLFCVSLRSETMDFEAENVETFHTLLEATIAMVKATEQSEEEPQNSDAN